jgi:hypothetical protein
MRSAKAKCNLCAWHAMGASELDVVDMAREHQAAVGHTVRIWVPEGWFGWGSYDMYPIPEVSTRERDVKERFAASWNNPFRYNGD